MGARVCCHLTVLLPVDNGPPPAKSRRVSRKDWSGETSRLRCCHIMRAALAPDVQPCCWPSEGTAPLRAVGNVLPASGESTGAIIDLVRSSQDTARYLEHKAPSGWGQGRQCLMGESQPRRKHTQAQPASHSEGRDRRRLCDALRVQATVGLAVLVRDQ